MAPVAPIDRLPPELLSDIFLCSLELEILDEENDPLDRTVNRGRPSFTLAVAAVSSRWRAIALSTSRLWSVITYDYHHRFLPVEESQRQHVQRWLERSRAADVRLRILCAEGSPSWSTAGYACLVGSRKDFVGKLLKENLARCRELRVTIETSHDIPFLFGMLDSREAPRLTHFDLTCHPSSISYHLDVRGVVSKWARLRAVRLYNIPFPCGLESVPQLRTLELEGVVPEYLYSNDFFNTLRTCNRLVELRLSSRGLDDIYRAGGAAAPLILPELTSLWLMSLPGRFVKKLTILVQMPALRHLAIGNLYQQYGRTGTESCLHILQRLDCSRLTCFELDERGVDSEGWLDLAAIRILLGSMPRLKILRLGFVRLLPDWCSALNHNAKSTSAPPFVPELSKLCIYGLMRENHLGGVIRALEVRATRSEVAPLMNLEVWVQSPCPSPEALAALKALVFCPIIHVVGLASVPSTRSRDTRRFKALHPESSEYRRSVLEDVGLVTLRTLTEANAAPSSA